MLSKSWNCENKHLLGGRGIFFPKNRFPICLNCFIQGCRLLIFFLNTTFNEWYWYTCCYNACFTSHQFQVIKMICMNQCSYSASKFGVFEGYLQFYQIKHTKIVFISEKAKLNVCIAWNFFFSINLKLKSKKSKSLMWSK